MDRGLSWAPSTGCCHLRSCFFRKGDPASLSLFRLEVDIDFGIAFDISGEILKFSGMGGAYPAWLSPGCCSGSISPPSAQSSSTKGDQLIFVGKKKKGKDKDGFELRSEIKKPQKIWWKGQAWAGQGPDVHLQEGPSSSSPQLALSVLPLELPDRSPVRRKVFEEPKTLLVGQTTICMWYRWQRQCLNCSKAKFERSSIQLIFTEKNVVGKKGKYVRSQTRRSRTKYAKLCVSYLIQGYQLLFGRSYVRCTCARLIAKVWPQERKYS